MVFLITGRQGSGKTTLARRMQLRFMVAGFQVVMLDGDIFRMSFPAGWDDGSKWCHLERMAKFAAMMEEDGNVVIVACIAPRVGMRCMMRRLWYEPRTITLKGGNMWPGTEYEEDDVHIY